MEKIIGVKVPKQKAQETISLIKNENNFNSNYKILSQKKQVIIPIKKLTNSLKNYKIIELKDPKEQKEHGLSFKDVLKKEGLNKQTINQIPNSYDIVGDIVIINIENQEVIKNYSKHLETALKKVNPHIKVVLNKAKEHHGEFRTQDLDWIAGENRKETIITENGCKLKTNVEEVFYSTRLATERKRIAKLVKENEVVGVFFAGVGPFAIGIAKLAKPKEVVAIELNPTGVKYLIENIKLNKLEGKVIPVLGDVKKVSKKYKDYFDRIPMPLPKSAEMFLDSAIYSCKDKGIIHTYNFVSKNNPFEKIEKILKEKEKENKVKLKIINKQVIRSFSPAVVQIVMDIMVCKK
ncbi:MAG: class I SAM-dependent methyltransferase family protein [Candidatus ainarchaeum sp.]|nr:class I SAM-dependent methyltransferase family protein [Candidatus ainarchaeum sp.]MDD4221476.1 class I SAM-dependent methyltransferase family protein [Candidatus ainarchaeum sp.]MDD4663006.1 class I SAM-dependent methyltransferase family protein [Candidatus ainarchaeum sp.]